MTDDGQQSGTAPDRQLVTTTAEQRRVGLIVAAIVSVAVIVVGLIVIISVSGGDDPATGGVVTVTDGSTAGTGDTGDTSSPGRSEPPADPCADAVLAADLQLAGATAALCDGTWAVASAAGGTSIAKFADDNAWHLVVDTAATAACRTEILNAGVPAEVVDAADWSCELTTKPVEWASESGVPYTFGQMGGHVWAAQHVLAVWGLMPHKSVDGYLGPETLQALVKFQLAAGVPATGAVDQPTITAMGIDPATRKASAPIRTQGSALGDIFFGSSVDGTIAALSRVLGPPDYVSPPSLFGAPGCPEAQEVAWSNLRVLFLRAETTGSLGFSAWSYTLPGPDLQLTTDNGRTLGVQYDETHPRPEQTGQVVAGDAIVGVYLLWPDGITGWADDSGAIQALSGGNLAGCWSLEP